MSCPQVFYRKGAFRNFAKFTGKHLCQNLFYNNFAGLRPSTLFKKETLTQEFSCEVCTIFKNIFFYRTSLAAAYGKYIIQSRVTLVWSKSIVVLISLEIFHQNKIRKRRIQSLFKHPQGSCLRKYLTTFSR